MPRAVDLRRVAEWTGTTIDEIQALNPELRRWTTPVKYPDYEVKVPVGTAEKLAARLASAPASDLGALNWYTVKRGETLADRRPQAAGRPRRSGGGEHLSVRSRDPSRAGTDHPARARDAAGGPHRASGARRRRVARHQRRRRRRDGRAEPARRRAPRRSPIASSAATRCPRSRGCSTPPSPSSAASTGCAAVTSPSAIG